MHHKSAKSKENEPVPASFKPLFKSDLLLKPARLRERRVRNAEAKGSNPSVSTKIPSIDREALAVDGFIFARNVQYYWAFLAFLMLVIRHPKEKMARFLAKKSWSLIRGSFLR